MLNTFYFVVNGSMDQFQYTNSRGTGLGDITPKSQQIYTNKYKSYSNIYGIKLENKFTVIKLYLFVVNY